MSDSERTKRIRDLNDAFRKDPTRFGRAVVTAGVNARGPGFVLLAMRAVASFKDFTEGNDPYGEHDFGSFELANDKLFWKIDCYEKGSDYSAGAETPDNPATTDRVLTVMLAEEY
jgi:hypothetical protein